MIVWIFKGQGNTLRVALQFAAGVLPLGFRAPRKWVNAV